MPAPLQWTQSKGSPLWHFPSSYSWFITLLSSFFSKPFLPLCLLLVFTTSISPCEVPLCGQAVTKTPYWMIHCSASHTFRSKQAWKTGLPWVAARSLNSGMWIVNNRSLFAIGISPQCGDKHKIEKMDKNYIKHGACSLKEVSRSLDLLKQWGEPI